MFIYRDFYQTGKRKNRRRRLIPRNCATTWNLTARLFQDCAHRTHGSMSAAPNSSTGAFRRPRPPTGSNPAPCLRKTPFQGHCTVVRLLGFEPRTSVLSGLRSNQLSYSRRLNDSNKIGGSKQRPGAMIVVPGRGSPEIYTSTQGTKYNKTPACASVFRYRIPLKTCEEIPGSLLP